ncbi:MAG: dTDP-4-dehydrorhamnose reductase [Chitinophagales bacterium]
MIKQRILVTGANGQLGRELQQLSSAYHLYDFIFLSREDLPVNHQESVKQSFKKHRPDFCINCAAYTAVDKAETEKESAFAINGTAAGNMAAACKEYNCQFIHISTDYVFDGNAKVPYKEDDVVNPQTVYGASKLEGERQAIEFNPGSIIIRTSWVYSQFGKNFVKTMLKFMSEKKEIGVVNDQYGSPTYAADLAEAILKVVGTLTTHHSPLTTQGIYHFSNEGVISWYDFAVTIKGLTGARCKINALSTPEYPTPAKRPAYSVLDKTKIKNTFGIVLKGWKDSLAVCLHKLE